MHLINHVNDFGWKEMRIVNLYANVITKKPSVSELQENSLAYIEEILEEEDIKTYEICSIWFHKKDWKNIEMRSFWMTFASYPDKIVLYL